MNQKYFRYLCGAVLLAAIFCRTGELMRSLEYDEIWTLTNYASAPVRTIFTSLETPNNHAFHSFCAKMFMGAFGVNILSLRLCAFLSGIAVVVLTGGLACRLFRSCHAALWAMILAGVSPVLIAYSQTARGYSLQSALILGAFLLLLNYRSAWSLAGAVFCAVLSVLTLPTSAVFLGAGTAVLVFTHLKNRRYWIFAVAAGAFSLFHLLWNYQAFRAGQSFGGEIAGIGDFLRFVLTTLNDLSCVPYLWIAAFAVLLFPRMRKTGLALFAVMALVFLSAIVTKAGGFRVYQFLLILLILCISPCLEKISGKMTEKITEKWRIAFLIPFLTVFLIVNWKMKSFMAPNWFSVFQEAKALPQNVLPVYCGNDCRTMAWNTAPEGTQDFIRRMVPGVSGRTLLMIGAARGCLNGITEDGSEFDWPTGTAGKLRRFDDRVTAEEFPLEPLAAPPGAGDKIAVIAFFVQDEEKFRTAFSQLHDKFPKFMVLNFAQSVPFLQPDGSKKVCRLYAVQNLPQIRWAEILPLTSPELVFFRIPAKNGLN